MTHISDLRPSPIAGLWYAGEPGDLAAQVDKYIQQAQIPAIDGEVVALVAPHAGHRYSGATAGHAFRAVLGQQRDLVAVVSPMHSFHPSVLLTTAHKAYSTPLGPVLVDRDALAALDCILQSQSGLALDGIAQDREHSLEIELPFLQRALTGSFQLLPLMIRSRSHQVAHAVGVALAEVLRGQSALLVASTDLSHFYPSSQANALDTEMLRQIAAFSPEGVLDADRSGTGYACGAGALAAVLFAARELGGNAVHILHHSDSGAQTGDHDSVVGYGAAIIVKRP